MSDNGHISGSGWGFEFAILLVAVVACVAYFFLPAREIAADKQVHANQATGGALVIQQSSHVYDAMVRYINDGAHQGQMTLDANPVTGIFSEYMEAGKPPLAHPGFFEYPDSPGARWVLNSRFVPDGKDQEWYGLVLPGIKKSLCQKLNAILHKDDVNAQPPVSVPTREQWISGRVELKGADSRLARRDGCAATSDGEYVFYRALIRR